VKILKNISTKEKRYNLNEIAFLKFCKCPNVVSFVGAYRQGKKKKTRKTERKIERNERKK